MIPFPYGRLIQTRRRVSGGGGGGSIVFVGQTSASAITGTSYTASLTSLSGGIASSPSSGDLVLVVSTMAANNLNGNASALSASGNINGAYTLEGSLITNTTAGITRGGLGIFFKIMGGSPDDSITLGKFNDNRFPAAATIQVWRNVSSSNPMDVPGVFAAVSGSPLVNCPSISPVTSGAKIIACGNISTLPANTPTVTGPSNMTGESIVRAESVSGNSRTYAMMFSETWSSGAFDPNQITLSSTPTGSGSIAVTLALRPA